MSRKQLSCSFVIKVYGIYNKALYLRKTLTCYNLETTFQKKVNFSQYARFIRSYYLTTFQMPVPAALSFLNEGSTLNSRPIKFLICKINILTSIYMS